MLASCYSYQSSFNPRICKRCDGNWIKSREYFNVSIHASVKDATNVGTCINAAIWVSIHASVKDATIFGWVNGTKRGFNPRICKRCDADAWATGENAAVSIHASVKDATTMRLIQIRFCLFQSTHL